MAEDLRKLVQIGVSKGYSLDKIRNDFANAGWSEAYLNSIPSYYNEFKKKSPAGTGLRADGVSPSRQTVTPSSSGFASQETKNIPLEDPLLTKKDGYAKSLMEQLNLAAKDKNNRNKYVPTINKLWNEYSSIDRGAPAPSSIFEDNGAISKNSLNLLKESSARNAERVKREAIAIAKDDGVLETAARSFYSGILGAANYLGDLIDPDSYDDVPDAKTDLEKEAEAQSARAQKASYGRKLLDGYTDKQIEDGFFKNFADGNVSTALGLFGRDLLEVLPQNAVGFIPYVGLPLMAASAGGQGWLAVKDDEKYNTLEKFLYAPLVGTAEYVTEKFLGMDRKMVQEGLSKAFGKTITSASDIPKKELGDMIFGTLPKAARAPLEEGLEEGLVSTFTQTLDKIMAEKPFDPVEIAESVMLGAGAGGSTYALVRGSSALLQTPLFSDVYKITNTASKIENILKSEDISDEERVILTDQLNGFKTQMRKLQDGASDYYKQFSQEDKQKTLELNQTISRGIRSYSTMKTAEAKAETVNRIKQSLAEKAQIEQRYDSAQKQQVPSPVVQGAELGGVPVQGTGTEAPQAGGVLQVPSQQEEKVLEAAKQTNVGFRPVKAKVTQQTLPSILSNLKSYVDSIPDKTLKLFKTTRQEITNGFESISNVISSFAKEGLNVDIEVVYTREAWAAATKAQGKEQEASRGLHYIRNEQGQPSKIILFAPALVGNTVYHEGIHDIVPQAFGQEGVNKVAKAFLNSLKQDPSLWFYFHGLRVDENGNPVMDENADFARNDKGAPKQPGFLSQYDGTDRSEEILAELGSMVAAGDIDIEIIKSLATRFMEAVASVLGAVGIKMAPNSSQLAEALLSYSQKLGAGAKLDIQKMEESRTRVQGLIGDLFTTLGIDLGAPMTPKDADAQRVKRQDLNLPKRGLDAFGQLKKAFGETNAKIIRSKVKSAIEYPDQFIEYVNKNFAVKEQVGQIVDVINADIEANFLLSIGKEKKAFKPEQLKSVEELAEKAGFVFYETETEQDVLSFKSDYRQGEVICTFKDVKGRLGEKYIFWMRKDGFETILPAKEVTREYLESDTIGAKLWREYLATVGIDSTNYKGVQPSREDPYGTSSLSVQIDKQDKSVMIINRYNHTVPNPDYTYKGKLDGIIQGLDDAIYSIPKVGGREEALDDDSEERRSKVVKDLDGRYFFAETSTSSHFISKYGYIEKVVGVFKPIDRSYQRILGAYVLNSKYNNINALFEIDSIDPDVVWKSLFPYRKIELSKDSVTIKTDYGTLKLGDINDKGIPESIEGDITQIGDYFDKFLIGATRLKKLDLPNLEIVGDEFLGSLTSYFSENRIKTDFDTISFPSLKEAGDSFLADAFEKNKSFEFNFPSLENAGRRFLQNINAKNNVLSFPRLKYFSINDFGKYVRLKRIQHSVDLFIPNLKHFDSDYYKELLDVQQLKSIVNDGLFDFLNEKKAALLKEKALFENVTKVLKENALDTISAERQVTEGILRMIPSWFETTKNNNLSSYGLRSILMTKGGTTVFNSKGEYFDPTEINETIGLSTRNRDFFGKFEPNEFPSVEVAPSEEAVIDSLSGDAPAGPIGEPQLIRKPPKAQGIIKVKDKYPLSFVNKKNVIDIDGLIDDIVKNNKKVYFWGGDQLGVGDYTDPYTGKIYDLQGGPSYSLNPKNINAGRVWATSSYGPKLAQKMNEADYVFIISGAPIGMMFFNKTVNDIWIDRAIKGFNTLDLFKEAFGKISSTKEFKAFSDEYSSWDELKSDLKNKNTTNKVKDIIKSIAEYVANDAAPFLDKYGLRVANFDDIRDGYFRENNFGFSEITTVYKPLKLIEGGSEHNQYSNAVLGTPVGVPNRRLLARDIMTEEFMSEKTGSGKMRKEASPSQLQKAIVPDTGGFREVARPKAPKRMGIEGKQSASFARDLYIAITPATTEREYNRETARQNKLSKEYHRLVEESEKGIDNSDRINSVASQILDAARKQLTADFSKIPGVAVKFDDDFRGLYNNVFEPSFNLKLRLTPQSDENKVSQILNEFAERYTQDAFIVETASEESEDFRKQLGENVMPLGDYDEKTNMSHFPQLYVEFTSPLSDKELNELSLSLRQGEIDGFSLNKKELKITIFPFLTEEQEKLSEDEQRRIKKEYYDKQINSAQEAMANVFRVGRDVKSEVRFRKSTYKGAKSTEGTTRQYDRDNFLKAHKEGLTKYELLAIEFNKLRLEEIELSKKKEKLPKDKQKRYDEIKSVIQPIIQDTIALNEPFYKEAKRAIERIALSVSRKLSNAFVSRFNIKRPERASIKVMRWYNSDIEDLGDGARVNIIVDNEQQADKLFNEINNRYPSKNPDRERRVNETTDLGYPKRLIEMDTKNGFIGEIQIMTPEGYLAKDGVDYFDDNQQDFARKRLKEVQNRLGWAIPDGIGHYFYEINRDENINDELRERAKALSLSYYKAFTNPSFKLSESEFTKELAKFKEDVDKADKSTWDEGNSGKSPQTLNTYLEKSGQKAPKRQDILRVAALKDVESTAKALEAVDKGGEKVFNDIKAMFPKRGITGGVVITDSNGTELAEAEFTQRDANSIEVENIVSREAGKGMGYGTKALQIIKNIADVRGVKVYLYPEPIKLLQLKGLTKDALVSFYEKNGFKYLRALGQSVYFPRSSQELSEAYHESKKDGSNPELVKAVEDLLVGEQQQPKRQGISKAQGPLVPVVYNSLLQQSTRNADGTNTPPYTLQEWLTMMTPYLNAQTATVIYNGVTRNKPPFTAPSIQDAYDSSKKRMEAGKNKAFFTWNNLKKYFIDRQAELKKAILASGMKNAYNYLVNKAGSGARAAYFYYEKEKDIYKDLKKEQIEKLDQIIMLRRIIEIDSNFDERGEARPKHTNDFNKEYAEMELARLQKELGNAAYNDLNDRATKYFDAFRSLLDSMYEEGLVSEELYEQLRDIDYQPRLFLDHVFEMDEPSMREMNLSAAQIKRIKEGSEGDIMFDSRFLLALYAKSAFSKIARNKANKEIAKATEAQGNESWVSKTDKPGFSEVTYFEDGVKKSFYLKDNLKSELDDISRVSGMPQNIQKLIGMVTGSFAVKLLATRANPLFVAKNVPRDYLHVLFFTKAYDNMSLPLAAMRLAGDFIKGVKSKLQDDQDFKDFVEFGGGMDFLSTEGMESMITNRTVTNKIIEKLGKAGELSEIGFRLAMYKKFKEDGMKALGPNATEDEVTRVKVQAVTQAREMIDFSQGGIATKNLEIVSPYINSAFQGFRVSTSYIQNNPKEFAKKLGYLSIGVLMLALYNAMLGDDDMEDIPEETKRKYFIIMTPFTFEEDGKTKRHYVKIAKTQQLAPFIAGLELTSDYFVAGVMGRKPRESKDAYEYAWKGATMYFPKDPSNIKKEISSSVPLFAAIAAYDMNYDTYRERAVSMDYNQVLPQDEDFTNKQVPYFYKALAQGIGASGGEAGPKRLQVATEKFVTTPYSSLLTMGAYTILDSFSRLFELKGPGGIPVKDQAAISNSVSKSLGLSMSKVFTGATEPDWRSYTRKEEIERINMEEKSERRGIKIAAQDIGQKYFEASNAKDSKAMSEARKEYQDGLMRIKKESGVPDAKYFMDAFQQARKYGKATNPEYNDISYAASNEAKARIIMEYGGRTMSRKELVEYINDYKRKTGKPINGSEILREYQKETGYGK